MASILPLTGDTHSIFLKHYQYLRNVPLTLGLLSALFFKDVTLFEMDLLITLLQFSVEFQDNVLTDFCLPKIILQGNSRLYLPLTRDCEPEHP